MSLVTIMDLPDEIILKIFSHCPNTQYLSLRLISPFFSQILSENDFIKFYLHTKNIYTKLSPDEVIPCSLWSRMKLYENFNVQLRGFIQTIRQIIRIRVNIYQEFTRENIYNWLENILGVNSGKFIRPDKLSICQPWIYSQRSLEHAVSRIYNSYPIVNINKLTNMYYSFIQL